jgi:hypothetical protein
MRLVLRPIRLKSPREVVSLARAIGPAASAPQRQSTSVAVLFAGVSPWLSTELARRSVRTARSRKY